MIGGNDTVFPAIGDSASLEACARMVLQHWPNVRFEDAVTAKKFQQLGDVPFGTVRELLAYTDSRAEALWDADSSNSPENSMLYLIVRPHYITVVLDDPNTPEMQSILNAIRDLLWVDIVSNYARAA